jgi:hypothetical protein
MAVLTLCDVQDLLCAVRPRRVVPLDKLLRTPASGGVGLRIDMCGRGQARLDNMLSVLRAGGFGALCLVEPLFSGLGHAREGRFVAHQAELAALARKLSDFSMGILARPGFAIAHAVSSPCLMWKDVLDSFEKVGMTSSGIGSPIGRDVSSLLSAVWLHRAAGSLVGQTPLEGLDRLPLHNFELLFETLDARLGPLLDGVDSYEAEFYAEGGKVFASDWLLYTDVGVRRSLNSGSISFLHTTPEGWLAVEGGSDECELDTKSAIEWARTVATPCLGIVLDLSHLKQSQPTIKGTESHRMLPWPFEFWLALSSDSDWTTPAHFKKQAKAVCELGLPFAGSAYLISNSRRWMSWRGSHETCATSLYAKGLLDTVHGLIHSHDVVPLKIDQDQEKSVHINLARDILRKCRAVLVSLNACEKEQLTLRWRVNGRDFLAENPILVQSNPSTGRINVLLPLPDDIFPDALIIGSRADSADAVQAFALTTTSLEIKQSIRDLHNQGLFPIVFTAHGGGNKVADWGQLWSDYGLSIYPDRASLALDHPQSPFYVFQDLRKSGVQFFNPMDLLFGHSLCSISQVIESRTAQDGTEYYAFTRYLSPSAANDPEASLSFAKHTATASGISATISEVLNRLSYARNGDGCLIYTHLGNRVGNQLSPRLGWSEDCYAAFAQLAECYRGQDFRNPLPHRIWVCRPSDVLGYGTMLRGIKEHMEVLGNKVFIRSWFDSAINKRVPDVRQYGGAWLHGLTVYVDEPLDASVEIDGVRYPHFTCNPTDETGRRSITLLDARDSQTLLSEPVTLSSTETNEPSECIVECQGCLDNITHVRVDLKSSSAARWEIGLGAATDSGKIIDNEHWARTIQSLRIGRFQNQDRLQPADSQHCFIFPLFDLPVMDWRYGDVTSLWIRCTGKGSLSVYSLDLLRPHPGAQFEPA